MYIGLHTGISSIGRALVPGTTQVTPTALQFTTGLPKSARVAQGFGDRPGNGYNWSSPQGLSGMAGMGDSTPTPKPSSMITDITKTLPSWFILLALGIVAITFISRK
jgi:hypothetical protein